MEGNKYLISIVGPTAIGKTEMAIRVAKELDTEILSADSRQFYKEMAIGTAKPHPEELSAVKHHFIDSISITEKFTVGDFETESLALLQKLFEKKKTVVLVGGSGLYINAVINGLDDLPKGDPAIRKSLNQKFEDDGISPLQNQLRELDPDYFAEVDINNPQRLIRALEVCLTTGQAFSSFRSGIKKNRDFIPVKIGLNTGRSELYERINSRVDKMIAEGLVEEVESLLPYKNENALQTVGYSEIFEYLGDKSSLDEAIDRIKQNTRRFAKRQLTWFRKDQEIQWFEPADFSQISNYIKQRVSGE